MIKAVIRSPDGTRKALFLGLSSLNLERLRDDKPIQVSALMPTGESIADGVTEIVIAWGATERHLARSLGMPEPSEDYEETKRPQILRDLESTNADSLFDAELTWRRVLAFELADLSDEALKSLRKHVTDELIRRREAAGRPD